MRIFAKYAKRNMLRSHDRYKPVSLTELIKLCIWLQYVAIILVPRSCECVRWTKPVLCWTETEHDHRRTAGSSAKQLHTVLATYRQWLISWPTSTSYLSYR